MEFLHIYIIWYTLRIWSILISGHFSHSLLLCVNLFFFFPDFLPWLRTQELDLLKDDANVYKLIGPVLVKQDLAEANANVRKRIDYISAELYVFSLFFRLHY